MRSAVHASLFAVMFLTSTAHSQEKDTLDSLTGTRVKELGTIADTLTGVTDKKTAEAARPKLAASGKVMADLQARMEKLGKPSAEEGKAVEKKYKEQTFKVASRIQAEAVRVAEVEGGIEVLKELERVFANKEPKK